MEWSLTKQYILYTSKQKNTSRHLVRNIKPLHNGTISYFNEHIRRRTQRKNKRMHGHNKLHYGKPWIRSNGFGRGYQIRKISIRIRTKMQIRVIQFKLFQNAAVLSIKFKSSTI